MEKSERKWEKINERKKRNLVKKKVRSVGTNE